MRRKYFEKILILSIFFLLVLPFGSIFSVADKLGGVYSVCIDVFGSITSQNEACWNQGIIYETEQNNHTKLVVVRYVDLDLSYFCSEIFGVNEGCKCFNCLGTDCNECDGGIIENAIYNDGVLTIQEEIDASLAAYYWFYAYDRDGCQEETIVRYGLYLYDGVINSYQGQFEGGWPPQEGITTLKFRHWEILNEGRPGTRERLCVGSNGFEPSPCTYIEVTVTPIT